MIAKNTRQISNEHEQFVTDLFSFNNSRRSRSSGAAWQDNVDVVTDGFVIECEATEGKSISVKKRLWQEVKSKIYGGKRPLIALRFRDPYDKLKTIDLIAVEAADYAADQEELETYRLQSITR